MLAEARTGVGIDQPFFERTLAPATIVPVPQRATGETFVLIIKPAGGLLRGTIYSDGSGVDIVKGDKTFCEIRLVVCCVVPARDRYCCRQRFTAALDQRRDGY